jgi:hypothetical protein
VYRRSIVMANVGRCSALILLGALLLGCSPRRDAFDDQPGDRDERARIAEAELRKLGPGRFEVDSFETTSEARLTFLDFYEHPTRVFALNFRAKAHCTEPFEVYSRDRLMARHGSPSFSMADFERDTQLLALFGEGELIPAQKLSIEASAAFDALEPGFRFRFFDRPRQSLP